MTRGDSRSTGWESLWRFGDPARRTSRGSHIPAGRSGSIPRSLLHLLRLCQVPLEVAPILVPGIEERWIETCLIRGVCRCTLRWDTPRDHESRRLLTEVANDCRFREQEHLAAGNVGDDARGRLDLDRALGRQQQRGYGACRLDRGPGWIDDASHQFEA